MDSSLDDKGVKKETKPTPSKESAISDEKEAEEMID